MSQAEALRALAVLGAGTMGHGITQLAAMAGFEVWMRDVEQRFLDGGLERIRWSLGKLREKGAIDEARQRQTLDRIHTTTELPAAVKQADLVIEAIPENLALKQETFRAIDQAAPPEAIFASNTSTFPITELANVTRRAGRVIGMHFFNPPQLMPLVEITRATQTADATVEVTEAVAHRLGKETVLCRKDLPGFLVNRILGAIVNEAAWLVQHGEASVVEIDSAVKFKLGLPMGLFEVVDYSGLDVIYSVVQFLESRGAIGSAPPLWSEYVAKGWLGAKTERGFYEWGTGGKRERPVIPPEAGERFDPRRVLMPGINAAAELVRLEAATVADVDKAVKLGLGFPRGVLEWADEIGLDVVVQLLTELQAQRGERYRPQPILTEYVQRGWVGRKAARGFYTYSQSVTEYKTVLVRKEPQERLAWLVLNRPQRLNTLTAEVLDELSTALDQLEQDPEVRAVILMGAGEKAFSAGADVAAFQQLTPVSGAGLLRKGQAVFRKVEILSKPVIAAIRGYALGGGCELAWACDFRIASQTAQLGQPEIGLGLIPGWGGTQRLVRLVGLAKAKEIVLLGDRYSAEDAHRLGLVHRVVPDAELEAEARRLAVRLAAAPPIAIRLAKTCLDAAPDSPLAAGLALETQSFLRLFGTEDLVEGLSAFLAKRKPDFKGK